MRDHLLGFPPAAEHSAEHETQLMYKGVPVSFDYVVTYPLGEPTRLKMERREKYIQLMKAAEASERETEHFQEHEFPNPDGSVTPACMKDAKRSFRRAVAQGVADKGSVTIMQNGKVLKIQGVNCKPAPGGAITWASLNGLPFRDARAADEEEKKQLAANVAMQEQALKHQMMQAMQKSYSEQTLAACGYARWG